MRNPIACFLEVEKTCVAIFGIFPRQLTILLESEDLVCSTTAQTKTALVVLQLRLNYFATSFYKTFDICFPGSLRYIPRWLMHSFLSPFLIIGMISPVC